jgi:hypothetical protein
LDEGDVASTSAPRHDPARAGRRHIVGPLILLGAGVLLLLCNLQIVPWSAWREIWPYWPVLLVLLGLEAFITGRVAWGTLVLLAIALPILGLVVSASDLAHHWSESTRATAGATVGQTTPTLRQRLDGATSALVEVEYGAGALDIGPLPADLAADTLADGQVYGHGGIRFEPRSTMEAGRRVLQIRPRDVGNAFDLGRLELHLTPSVPIDLQIESGVTEMTLNLESLQIPNLSIETGASKAQITLPARGQTAAQIEGGAARIDITVPPNVAARIIVDGGPNQVEIDQRRFPRQGGEYRSPDFETAADRVTLRIEVGASRVAVQ